MRQRRRPPSRRPLVTTFQVIVDKLPPPETETIGSVVCPAIEPDTPEIAISMRIGRLTAATACRKAACHTLRIDRPTARRFVYI